MIYSVLESTMRSAIDLDENKNEDGSINWNFVDADAYAECINLFRDSNEFYDAFNEVAEKIEPTVDNNQLEMEV